MNIKNKFLLAVVASLVLAQAPIAGLSRAEVAAIFSGVDKKTVGKHALSHFLIFMAIQAAQVGANAYRGTETRGVDSRTVVDKLREVGNALLTKEAWKDHYQQAKMSLQRQPTRDPLSAGVAAGYAAWKTAMGLYVLGSGIYYGASAVSSVKGFRAEAAEEARLQREQDAARLQREQEEAARKVLREVAKEAAEKVVRQEAARQEAARQGAARPPLPPSPDAAEQEAAEQEAAAAEPAGDADDTGWTKVGKKTEKELLSGSPQGKPGINAKTWRDMGPDQPLPAPVPAPAATTPRRSAARQKGKSYLEACSPSSSAVMPARPPLPPSPASSASPTESVSEVKTPARQPATAVDPKFVTPASGEAAPALSVGSGSSVTSPASSGLKIKIFENASEIRSLQEGQIGVYKNEDDGTFKVVRSDGTVIGNKSTNGKAAIKFYKANPPSAK